MVPKLDLIVLGLLSQKSMHGYRIAEFFLGKGIHDWMAVKKPSVYKALNRLEDEKYISGEYQTEVGKPPRKVFHITPEGKKHIREILKSFFFTKKFTSPPEFWHYLRFAKGNLTQTEFIKAIENRIQISNKFEEKMLEKKNQALRSGMLDDMPFYGKIVENMMKKFQQASAEALEQMKQEALLPENKSIFIQED
ncbi:MAG: PadR family transcriptional regulator [Candidatus Cloacimonadota bacterium]|nr:PadR family transcriptional regulator [Candidatus Cloacimonadota bacterium]